VLKQHLTTLKLMLFISLKSKKGNTNHNTLTLNCWRVFTSKTLFSKLSKKSWTTI